MPFASERQRKWMHIHEPEIAHKWEHGKHSTKGKRGHRMPSRKRRT